MTGARIFAELSLTWLDIGALLFFVLSWAGYALFAEWRAKSVPSLHNTMDRYRRDWMLRMIERDNRMVDVNIMRNLTRSSQFFASTTMLVLGALIALLGYVQQAMEVVSGLPFTVKASQRLLEIKIVLLVLIFVYAFFKFSWAIRQLGFCSTLVGAAPKPPKDNPEQYSADIERIAAVTSYAGTNFNDGLRSYYFALAAMTWFLHPYLMIIATAWVVYVLHHREFESRTLHALIR
ncbi:MAG: DUF599 domain-containing protein [Burkholderiales bacterium]|jgi:uncharacterized membrane protein|nr:DUF599 domain-containing protein [Burkholderiales bacterium]MDP2398120.1 DUF599 domain-containing protein [Burkholderiales bacterium]